MNDLDAIARQIQSRNIDIELQAYGARNSDINGLSFEEKQRLLDILKAQIYADGFRPVRLLKHEERT